VYPLVLNDLQKETPYAVSRIEFWRPQPNGGADGAVPLWITVEEVYSFVEHQLCCVHKLRPTFGGMARYCPKSFRQECVRQAAQIMYAASVTQAAKRFRAWKEQWQYKVPKAVACLERDHALGVADPRV
jgi:transposase-like protein